MNTRETVREGRTASDAAEGEHAWVVVCSDMAFQPPVHGCYARITELVRAMRAAGVKVRFIFWDHFRLASQQQLESMGDLVDDLIVVPWSPDDPGDPAQAALPGMPAFALQSLKWLAGRCSIAKLHRFPFLQWLLSRSWSYRDSSLEAWCPQRLRAVVRDAAAIHGTVGAIAIYAYLTPCFDELGDSSILRVVDTLDLNHVRTDNIRRNRMIPHGFLVSRESEAHLLAKADLVVAIQNQEAETIRTMLPGSRVMVVPHGVALPAVVRGSDSDGKNLVLLASNNEFNVHGLKWFLRHVWPLVLANEPLASLHVFGQLSETPCCFGPRIERHGVVDDPGDAYATGNIVVNPVQMGTGLKIKTVEAMVYGKAIVTTSQGAEGIENPSELMEVADDPQEFALAILELFRDPQQLETKGLHARSHAEEHFAWEHVYAPLLQALRKGGRKTASGG